MALQSVALLRQCWFDWEWTASENRGRSDSDQLSLPDPLAEKQQLWPRVVLTARTQHG